MLLEMKMQGLQMERKINRKKRERKRGGKKLEQIQFGWCSQLPMVVEMN